MFVKYLRVKYLTSKKILQGSKCGLYKDKTITFGGLK